MTEHHYPGSQLGYECVLDNAYCPHGCLAGFWDSHYNRGFGVGLANDNSCDLWQHSSGKEPTGVEPHVGETKHD